MIPIGILQKGLLTSGLPFYINYGTFGTLVAHTLNHAFDHIGQRYDSQGTFRNWWDPATKKLFEDKQKCLIDQYESVFDKQTNLKLKGSTTQQTNIADTGGVEIAYKSYKNFVARNGVEKRLPGLDHYTPEQLFWISWAQVWCSKSRTEFQKVKIESGNHPPDPYRVLLPLSNSKDFAKDFKCPKNSRMNPEKKCTLWASSSSGKTLMNYLILLMVLIGFRVIFTIRLVK